MTEKRRYKVYTDYGKKHIVTPPAITWIGAGDWIVFKDENSIVFGIPGYKVDHVEVVEDDH